MLSKIIKLHPIDPERIGTEEGYSVEVWVSQDPLLLQLYSIITKVVSNNTKILLKALDSFAITSLITNH